MVNGACVSLANSPVWKWALPLPVLTWRWWCGSAPVLPYPRSAASPSPHWSPLSGSWSPLQSWWCNYLQTHTKKKTGYKTQCLICKGRTHCTQCELDSCSNSTDQMTHNLLGGLGVTFTLTWKCVVCKPQEETALPHSWNEEKMTGWESD